VVFPSTYLRARGEDFVQSAIICVNLRQKVFNFGDFGNAGNFGNLFQLATLVVTA
jgi:hypothetical protein